MNTLAMLLLYTFIEIFSQYAQPSLQDKSSPQVSGIRSFFFPKFRHDIQTRNFFFFFNNNLPEKLVNEFKEL